MLETIQLQVHLAFDSEAEFWYVSRSDIPGLSLEADTPGALVQRIGASAPELIELNLNEIIATYMAKAQADGCIRTSTENSVVRPQMSLLPVFDNSMDLVFA